MDAGCLALLVYLGAMSLGSLLLWRLDKRAAIRGARRMPERRLLQLGYLGGVAGGLLGMRLFAHKTSKQPFAKLYVLAVPVVLAWALGLAYLLGCLAP